MVKVINKFNKQDFVKKSMLNYYISIGYVVAVLN